RLRAVADRERLGVGPGRVDVDDGRGIEHEMAVAAGPGRAVALVDLDVAASGAAILDPEGQGLARAERGAAWNRETVRIYSGCRAVDVAVDVPAQLGPAPPQ